MLSNDLTLNIRISGENGAIATGPFDLAITHRPSGEIKRLQGVAVPTIPVRGLRRSPRGDHEVVIESRNGDWPPLVRGVQIPETGAADLSVVVPNSARPAEGFAVSGTVRDPNGNPSAGVIVAAFDRDMRGEEQLGESPTDAEGRYQIRFSLRVFGRAEKRDPDLLMKVRDARGRVIYDPGLEGVVFNAPPDAVIDIDLPVGSTRLTSEIERIQSSVGPLLDGVAVADLQEDAKTKDLTFLTRETAWSGRTLQHWVVAHRLARQGSIAPEVFYAIVADGAVFRADPSSASMLRFDVDLGTEILPLLYDIALLEPAVLRASVQRSIAQNRVPADTAMQTDAALKILEEQKPKALAYVREQRSKQIFDAIGKRLQGGVLEQLKQILTEDALLDIPSLLDRLGKTLAFKNEATRSTAATVLSLGDVIGFNEPLLAQVAKEQGIQKPQDVQKLAKLNAAEWRATLTRSASNWAEGGQGLSEEAIGLHASQFARKLEQRFPTTAFAAQLERDGEAPVPQSAQVAQLMNDHPDFDLARTNLTSFFKKNSAKFGGDEKAAALRDAIKPAQRVFKLAPTYNKTSALLKQGLRSAAHIRALGQQQFVDQFADEVAFTKAEAEKTFQTAASVNLATGLLAGQIRGALSASQIAILNTTVLGPQIEAVTKEFPNLENLFSFRDSCECQQCNSVYGPAAYMVDVLQFLKARKTTKAPSRTAKDELFSRRPDLGDLDLTCVNANTPLPYIDLVCELLEEAVAPTQAIAFSGAIGPGGVSTKLLGVLQSAGLPFAAKASISTQYGAGRFAIHDASATCRVEPDGPGTWWIFPTRQTHGTAAERGALPEYVNQGAYGVLATKDPAFSLPFDLNHQEASAYLAQLAVSRAELMRALQTSGSPSEAAIAAEALGLTNAERKLIVAVDLQGQKRFWTPTGPPTTVEGFLNISGLSYAELEELLRGNFANAGRHLFIQHQDDSCDLAKKVLKTETASIVADLTPGDYDRFHRLLRLRKKLGWRISTLDRLISAGGVGNGALNDNCLVQLAAVKRAGEQLRLSIDGISDLYAVLEVEGEHATYANVFLNKAANGNVDPDFLPEAVLRNQASFTIKLATKLSYLALCMGSSPSDIGMLLKLNLTADLTFKEISKLYGAVRLAKLTGLSISDYLVLRAIGPVPSALSDPTATLRFLEVVATYWATPLRADDLNFLLNHAAKTAADLAARELSATDAGTWLSGLAAQYSEASLQNTSPFGAAVSSDENRPLVRATLNTVPGFAERDIQEVEGIIDGRFSNAFDAANLMIGKLPGVVSPSDKTEILTQVAALHAALASQSESARNALIEVVLRVVSGFLLLQAKKEMLASAIVQQFKFDKETTSAILRVAELRIGGTGAGRVEDILTKVPAGPGAPFAARLLRKMAFLLRAVKVPASRVEWLLQHSKDLGWLELDDLAYQSPMKTTWAKWEEFVSALALFKDYPPVQDPTNPDQPFTMESVFERLLQTGATPATVMAALAAYTNWDSQTLSDLQSQLVFAIDDFKRVAVYRRIEATVTLLRKTRLSAGAAAGLLKPVLAATDCVFRPMSIGIPGPC